MRVFEPRPQQIPAIDFLMKNERCALWCFMGGGKTSAVLTTLEYLAVVEDVYPALVISTLRVASKVWPDEIKEWGHLRHLRVVDLTKNNKSKLKFKKEADIYTINFESIENLVKELKNEWPFKTIIIDEASKLAGFRLRQGAKRAKIIAGFAFRSKRFIELSGTPASNGLQKLWGQMWFIDQGKRLGRTYTAFLNRWFKQSYDGFSWDPLPHAEKEIMEKIGDVCLSLQAKDYYPVEEPIPIPIEIELPTLKLRDYKELEKKMYLALDDKEIEPMTAAARSNKCLQYASGCLYVEKEEFIEVHDEKLKALDSIIEEANGAPVLISYNFKFDLDRILKRYPQARHLDKNPKTINRWNRGEIPILVAHPASAGHGLSLQNGGNILVYFSLGWNLEEFEQIAERIGPARQKQSGFDRPVFHYFILVKNTIEYAVLERLKTKKSIQQVLLERMSRRVETDNG